MGFNTAIQWTKHTWNPVQGCHKISEGCKNCYMFSDKKRYGQDGNNVHRSTDATFFKPLSWHKAVKADTPLTERLVFTASWSDWFIEENDTHRAEMWQVVKDTPNLIYQILTKRADRIQDCLPSDWGNGYDNVWLGVSCENQQRADERIPLLLDTPAAIRFLSCEPLLSEVDITNYLYTRFQQSGLHHEFNTIDWVIVGGESGHNARPCALTWISFIAHQCRVAKVPCFIKQLGKYPFLDGYYMPKDIGVSETCFDVDKNITTLILSDKKGGDPSEWPEDLRVREFPLKNSAKFEVKI